MKTSTLREVSKFASGLVAADFFGAAWLYTSDLLPLEIWGINVTSELAVTGMVFDAVLFLLLVHYAWHAEIPSPSIKKRNFFYLVGLLLGIVSIMHLLRLIFGLEVTIGAWNAPHWLSWLGTILTGYISYASWKFARS